MRVDGIGFLQQSYNFDKLKLLMISSIAVLGAELHETAIYHRFPHTQKCCDISLISGKIDKLA